MENTSVSALIKKAEALHAPVKVRMSLDLVDPQLVHFHVQSEEANISGFGSGFSKLTAFTKAYAEYIERATFREYAKTNSGFATSSGFAAHVSLENAAEAALSEMVERDAFLCCWLTGRAPYWLQSAEIGHVLFSDFGSVYERFSRNGLDIKLGVVAKTGPFHVAIGMIMPLNGVERDFGFVIETAAGRSLQDALFAVYQGCCRHATLCLNRRERRDRVFNDLTEAMIAIPADHLEFYLNPVHALDWLLAGSPEITALSLPAYDIQKCQVGANIFDLKVVKCISTEFQEYFVGSTNEHHINRSRLQREFGEIELNWRVHPLS